MKCGQCAKEEAEYQCSSCNKLICFKCQTTEGRKVFCSNCAPKPKPESRRHLKKFMLIVGIIFIGMIIIYYIMDNYIPQIAGEYISSELISLFRTFSLFLIAGVGSILFILFVIYLYLRRR